VWNEPREEGKSPYRGYYEGGKRGTTLQGGGTAGGLGVDAEFFETSLVPSIVVHGFLGLNPNGSELEIAPRLPENCPEMGVSNLLYQGVLLDIKVGAEQVAMAVKGDAEEPVRVRFAGARRRRDTGEQGKVFALREKGVYCFERL
jgi:hypothetical protein